MRCSGGISRTRSGGSARPRVFTRSGCPRPSPTAGARTRLEPVDRVVDQRPHGDQQLAQRLRELALELGRDRAARELEQADDQRGQVRGTPVPASPRSGGSSKPLGGTSPAELLGALGRLADEPLGRRGRRVRADPSGTDGLLARLEADHQRRRRRTPPTPAGRRPSRPAAGSCACGRRRARPARARSSSATRRPCSANGSSSRSCAPRRRARELLGDAVVQHGAGVARRRTARRRGGRASPAPITSRSKYGARSTGTGAKPDSTSSSCSPCSARQAPK